MTDDQALAAAVTAANGWTVIARPIIQASIELDRVVEDTLFELRKMEPDQRRTFDEAASPISRAVKELDGIIEAIRYDFIADHSKSWTRGLSEAEAEALDEWNDALGEQVTAVKDFVRQVEREDREAL